MHDGGGRLCAKLLNQSKYKRTTQQMFFKWDEAKLGMDVSIDDLNDVSYDLKYIGHPLPL